MIPTRAYSWLKAATTAFTFKTLLRHYAKQATKHCKSICEIGTLVQDHNRGSVSVIVKSLRTFCYAMWLRFLGGILAGQYLHECYNKVISFSFYGFINQKPARNYINQYYKILTNVIRGCTQLILITLLWGTPPALCMLFWATCGWYF